MIDAWKIRCNELKIIGNRKYKHEIKKNFGTTKALKVK